MKTPSQVGMKPRLEMPFIPFGQYDLRVVFVSCTALFASGSEFSFLFRLIAFRV